ncbi:MAG: OmpA family protein [Candidatus Melainabacteria bacterium]|nr:MAG: OmpA family protein [Candidatus Melainabacteria bacterium]
MELFDSNSWELTQNGKNFLDKFLPLYFDVLLSDDDISHKISQIVIEGHTDSNSFHQAKNDKDNYNLNLELSAKRALSVSKYIFKQKL